MLKAMRVCCVVLALVVVGRDAGLLTAQGAAPRVVAVGDIHGDLTAFTSMLERAGLIDPARRWVGGSAVLVQLGDYTDRGPKVREVMELLMDLEEQAPRQKGRVVVLLGNHEVMNLMGDVRYVTPEIYASFADAKSENRRQSAYDAYVARERQSASRDAWMTAHPPGFVEYAEAFAPRGRYGAWLRRKSVVFRAGDVAFLHGGLDPGRASASLDAINRTAAAEIRRFDNLRSRMIESKLIFPFSTFQEILAAGQREINALMDAVARNEEAQPADWMRDVQQMESWSVLAPDGPLWFRGYTTWSEPEGESAMRVLTSRYGIARVAVGHTITQTKRITPRFSRRVFLIDTGMSSTYVADGTASALEIRDGRFTAMYPSGETMILDAPAAALEPAR